MFNITEFASELNELTKWQETPEILGPSDYVRIVVRAMKQFFVDINHPDEYDPTLYTVDEDDNTCYDRTFALDEEVYIMTLCKIEFFKRVQTDVNNAFGYKTDALTVTNADKPYANLQNTLDDLDLERRRNFNKMIRYTLG